MWVFVQSFLTEEWWLLTPSRPSSYISVPRVLSFQPAVFSPFLGPIPILLNSMSELRFPLISAILKQNNKKHWPTLAALFCPFIFIILQQKPHDEHRSLSTHFHNTEKNTPISLDQLLLCPFISTILQQKPHNKHRPTLEALLCQFLEIWTMWCSGTLWLILHI